MPSWNACRLSSSFQVIASFGIIPLLKPSTIQVSPATASALFTAGLPSAVMNSPPAEFTASATLQVRPSYFWNWPE